MTMKSLKRPASVDLQATALDLIQQAENFFGSRAEGWALEKVYVDNTPYPELRPYQERKRFDIRVTTGELCNIDQIRFQLAHEAVHSLDPFPGDAAFIEEGFAVWFTTRIPYCDKNYISRAIATLPGTYTEALGLVRKLLAMRGATPKAVRAIAGNFRDIKAADLMALFPKFDPNAADRLCSTVPMTQRLD